MGQAKQRGTREQRAQQSRESQEAVISALKDAEVVICLSEDATGINVQTIPRDEEPNPNSLAVIVASWLNSNLAAITKAAVLAKLQSEQRAADVQTDGGTARVVAQLPKRSVTTVDGALAKDVPALVGPDGRPLQ